MGVETMNGSGPEGESSGGQQSINWQGASDQISMLTAQAGIETPDWFSEFLPLLSEASPYAIEIVMGMRLLGTGEPRSGAIVPERKAFYANVARAAEERGAPWQSADLSYVSQSWQRAAAMAEYAAIKDLIDQWQARPEAFAFPNTDTTTLPSEDYAG